MVIARRGRKALLATHLTVSLGWIGAAAAYVVLGLAAESSEDAATIRAAWIGMELIGWFVIVPMALASLATGVIMGLVTRWGLLRHYWVVISLVLTTFATAVLLLHMPTVSAMADDARQGQDEQLSQLGGDLGHPTIGLALLIAILALNVIKPRGLTRRGRATSG